jgi:hypothetical protein
VDEGKAVGWAPLAALLSELSTKYESIFGLMHAAVRVDTFFPTLLVA